MKNAAKHAEQLKSLYKRLTKESKAPPLIKQEPLKALVRSAMSYDVSDGRADEAIRAIEREFVDLNELRVATDLEIAALLGTKYPVIERRVALITQSLNQIFEKEHTLNLDRLNTLNKRDARQFLRELPEMNPFVEAYVMLYSFDAAAMPVDDEIVNLLREEGVVDDKAAPQDAQRFLEHNLKAEEVYEFFVAVRRVLPAEGGGDGGAKKKVKAKM